MLTETPPDLRRSGLRPAVAVVVAGLLLGLVLPLIDKAVPGPAKTGTNEWLHLGSGVVVAVPAGWFLKSGVRDGAKTIGPQWAGTTDAALSLDGVDARLVMVVYDGDSLAMIKQAGSLARPGTVVAPPRILAGDGFSAGYTYGSGAGVLAAFAFPGLGYGLVVNVYAADAGRLATHRADVDTMLDHVTRFTS